MSKLDAHAIGKSERATQNRVVQLFQNQLHYRYLGNWEDRENSNVEMPILGAYLKKQGYSENLISKAIFEFNKAAGDQGKNLYDSNFAVFQLLRYGVKVREEFGENKQTVWLINWKEPQLNDFAIAEEVSVKGVEHKKRPDIVLYINGIAIGIIELKRSKGAVEDGIYQNLDNQKSVFIQRFFNTMQLIMAGNDSQGIRYATIETPAKYYLTWKEPATEEYDYVLDKHLMQLCQKDRLLELIKDFIIFDGGRKKLCRPHQYFGVKESQNYIKRKEGGIIWHTQGSGKSLTMVWLAKWIRENVDNSRVLIITDRDELDRQIVRVFGDTGEKMIRAKSGADLVDRLNKNEDALLSTLIHKFGRKEEGDFDGFIEDITKFLPPNYSAKGDVYVFVDECHRTQSGKLHDAMKAILPNALFIGFTGTPLLKKDKQKSIEIFGPYIHTYKFNEAVEDKVVLDLLYEARDIDQRITDQQSIDQWFDSKTATLNDLARAELKQRWGTMQKVLSSKSRLEKIVFDIIHDFGVKPRLNVGEGNAILVSGSVYQACRYYELFQLNGLKECAIITSYNPHISDIKGEETGEGETEQIQKYEIYQKMLNGKATDVFEEEVKELFIKQPANMKLLIVVDKLLTGFDAPPATYLYIDKKMQDHGLFQAICRVNRLDANDKEYGYIIDYKDLFDSIDSSMKDYTSEAFDDYDKGDVEGLMKDRYKIAKERLDTAIETVIALCEPVHPQDDIHFQRYFCGDPEFENELKEKEPLRLALYTHTVSLIRAFANIAIEMPKAGYTPEQIERITNQVRFYTDLRDYIKKASGDYIDLKSFEPGMRQLIDMYISADASRKISNFEDISLVELLVTRGVSAIDTLPDGIKKNQSAVAETIENNLRKVIIEESPTNPKYYERMSMLLEELIKERKRDAEDYEAYLLKIVELAKKVQQPESTSAYPSSLNTKAKRALYDNLNQDENLAVLMDAQVKYVKKDNWQGSVIKEKELKLAVKSLLPDPDDLDRVFDIIKKNDEYR
jgi:type I restriction enzyme R subunit